jgi:hypothetical protein
MNITIHIADDSLALAGHFAQQRNMTLDEAVSQLIRQSFTASGANITSLPPRGRFALAPLRDDVITCQHVRAISE